MLEWILIYCPKQAIVNFEQKAFFFNGLEGQPKKKLFLKHSFEPDIIH